MSLILSKRTTLLIALLMLLLHGSLLIFLLFAHHMPSDKLVPELAQLLKKEESHEQQQVQDDWVATYGQSNASVIFENPSAPPTPSTEPVYQEPETKMPVKQPTTEEIQNDVRMDSTKPTTNGEEITKKLLTEKILNTNIDQQRETSALLEIIETARGEHYRTISNTDENTIQLTEAHEEKAQPEKPEPIEQPQDKKIETAQTIQKQIQRPAAPAQKQLTLSQLARGFAQHIANEGTDAFSSAGKRDGKITAEQIMYAQYNDKISACLSNSLQIHKDKFYCTQDKKTDIAIMLEIGTGGTVEKLQIVSSSGVAYIDKFMLFIFRDAASSFPPLPSHFKNNPFRTIRSFSHVIASIKNPSSGRWAPIR